ncbi:hypothetical protein NC651_020161 [Populus alba x Populus x berolinensis]|nr:hypothetical protein NC651_020161 [Populus alba x Populus x berolinensis]
MSVRAHWTMFRCPGNVLSSLPLLLPFHYSPIVPAFVQVYGRTFVSVTVEADKITKTLSDLRYGDPRGILRCCSSYAQVYMFKILSIHV